MMSQKEFDMRKSLIELEHKYKMEEIEKEFQRKLEVQRIRSAEIKRTIERKSDMNFMEDYSKR
jgi:hypothetical protein